MRLPDGFTPLKYLTDPAVNALVLAVITTVLGILLRLVPTLEKHNGKMTTDEIERLAVAISDINDDCSRMEAIIKKLETDKETLTVANAALLIRVAQLEKSDLE